MNVDAVARLAAADFSEVGASFAAAGFQVFLPAAGILQIKSSPVPARSVLLSVGVHGDETAPIEMVAHLLAGFAAAPQALRVDLMIVVGNVAAIAEGKRFIDTDLNRLFSRQRSAEGGAEALRADVIMQATDAFFAGSVQQLWHLDLHTAIRGSHYTRFAIMPDVIGMEGRKTLIDWLGSAAIEAAVLNRKPAGTYSAYCAAEFGAIACTAELGRIGVLGQNDLSQFAGAQAALQNLLRGAEAGQGIAPQVFTVAQELIKHSEEFQLNFDAATENFTAFAPGAVVAHDGEKTYRVGSETEYVVFPNPNVAVGKRAGLMVVKAA